MASNTSSRSFLRIALAISYAMAGWFHLTAPAPFLQIMPGWVPEPEAIVYWTGVAEMLGAVALLQPWSSNLMKMAGWALAAYAVCVFPANINHFMQDMDNPDGGMGLAYHVPRLALQPLLVWLALWASRAIDWPFGER